MCLLPLACRSIQCPQTAVAVGLERTHAEVVGQGQGLLVGGLGRRTVRGLPMRCNVTEEAQGIRLVTALLVRIGERALAEGLPPPGGRPAVAPPRQR